MPRELPNIPPLDSPVIGAADPTRNHGNWTGWVKVGWLAGWLVIATLLVFPAITLSSLVSKTGSSMFHLSRLWAWLILKVSGVRVVLRGGENIDRSRAYMIIANHQSHFDGPALAWGLGGLQFRWIAKAELLHIPLFGHCLNSSRNIFIDRSDREAALESINRGIERLPQRVSVMCFAEGTRSDTGRIGDLKKGGFVAALKHGMPLLPITINGSRYVLPKGGLKFRPGIIELVVAAPIETAGKSQSDLDLLMKATRQAIQSHHVSQQ